MGRVYTPNLNKPEHGAPSPQAYDHYIKTGESYNGYTYDPDQDIQAQFDSQGASTTRAMISRAQWEDYKTRFQPFEDELIGLYGDEGLDDQISRNVDAVNTSFDHSVQSAADKRQLYNANMTGRQASQHHRNMQMQRGMAQVHATNMTRLARKDRNMNLLAGNASSPTDLPEA